MYLHLFHSNDRKRKIFLSFKPPFFKSLQLTTDNSIMYDNLKRSTVSVLTPHKCLAKAFTNRKKKSNIYKMYIPQNTDIKSKLQGFI